MIVENIGNDGDCWPTFILNKKETAALLSVRDKLKDRQPLVRYWYLDAGRRTLYSVGPHRLVRVCNASKPLASVVDVRAVDNTEIFELQKQMTKDDWLLLRLQDKAAQALIVRSGAESPPLGAWATYAGSCRCVLRIDYPQSEDVESFGPAITRIVPPANDDSGRVPSIMFNPREMDAVVKVGKAILSTECRILMPKEPTGAIRVDFAAGAIDAGHWVFVIMPKVEARVFHAQRAKDEDDDVDDGDD